jgi:hypothetical protein
MRKRIYYILLILFFIAVGPLAEKVMAGQLDDLEARIEINEARLDDAEDSFETFMDISGYFAMMYISTDKQNMIDRFRLHHVNLLFDKEVAEGWDFHLEIEFEDGTRLEGDGANGLESGKDQGAVIIETLYVDAKVNDYLTLRIGRYLDPAGIWNVDHYAPFVPTMIRPQIISNKVFPDTLDGVQAFGNRPIGGEYVGEYHLYVANGFGESGKTDSNEEKAVGGSFNLKFLSFYGLDIGVSVFSGRDSDQKERDAQGFDVKFRVKNLKFQAEYATADLKPGSGAKTEKSGWYGQFEYDIDKVSLIYRYDTYEDTSKSTDKEMVVNTVGVNYHFTTNIVAKLENHWHKPENTEKYTMTVATLAIFLGN